MNWPGENVLTRLIDALENGVGGFLRPWQIRRVGKANAEARATERLLLEQNELDIADLKAGRKRLNEKGLLVACTPPPPLLLQGPHTDDAVDGSHLLPGAVGFVQVAQSTMLAGELQRAVNLKRIALYAEEEAEEIDNRSAGGEHPDSYTEARLDADWLAKWRTGAQDVSLDEMQRLWGKLLAGEVAKPGTYSLHSVDFLARMSPSDANLLARLAPFATEAGIIRLEQEFFARHGLQFVDFLFLDDLGLINGTVGAGSLNATLAQIHHNGRALSTLPCGKHVLIFDMGATSDAPPKTMFDVFSITRVGREILTLAQIPANLEYVQQIAEVAVARGAVEVQMGTLHPDGKQIVWPRTIAKKTV